MWPEQDVTVGLAEMADETGLDLIGIQDHPYQWRFYDTWTLISYLAGRTSRVRFFPDVINLGLRPPAMLAKSVASLDVLTGGRVELGLGAGGFWDAVVGMGGPRRSPSVAFQATEEAIDVIRLIWSGERGVRYEGEHYRLGGVHTGPEPAHDIAIWVGANGPRMLDLIGRKADGWVPSMGRVSPEQLPGLRRHIDDGARRAGREPTEISIVYNVSGMIGSTGGDGIAGPVSFWAKELVRISQFGVNAFVFWPGGDDPIEQARLFAEQVVPELR
jgi:alkanesulfonate monooxygenase SsuD/methylene tetrahydromethanopterin reductase-like flavin-dependent oxidoreductase (luciferase family)